MQKVDYYAGIPLCFLVSIFEFLRQLFHSAQQPKEIKKILFIELSEMGSAILAYPALKKAANAVGSENLYFLIFESNRESVEVLRLLPEENIICIDSSNFLKFALTTFKALIKIRSLKLSACLDLELFSRCTALISYLSGATLRAGFYNYTEEGLYRGNLINRKIYYNHNLHMSASFMALMESVFGEGKDTPLLKKKINPADIDLPRFQPSENHLSKIKGVFSDLSFSPATSKLYLLNPDPGLLSLRGWSKENFAELAKQIIEKSTSNFVGIAGLHSSKHYYDFINNYCKSSNVLDFTGKTANLKELLALLSFTSCLITNDSGPAHMAALTDTKTVVLFGPETPVRYAPLNKKCSTVYAGLACSPCFSAANHRHSVCNNNVCMQQITVSEVFNKIPHG